LERHRWFASAALALFVACGLPLATLAQSTTPGQIPVDAWPHVVKAGGDTLTVYEPQVESWQGNVLRARGISSRSTTTPRRATWGTSASASSAPTAGSAITRSPAATSAAGSAAATGRSADSAGSTAAASVVALADVLAAGSAADVCR